jgi:hypothetical protein
VSEQRISVDIPNLLIKAGVVSTHDLSEAVQVSRRLQLPVSRVLLTSGAFSDEVFLIALDLQLLMDEELINLESAINSLKRVASGKSTPDQVLDEIYSLPKFGRGSKSQAELLKLAGIVSDQQIEDALNECAKSGATLGSALILNGVLSAGFFPVVLRVQERLRKGKINSEDATRQLREEYAFWQKAEASQRFASLQAESHAQMQELAEKQRRSPKSSHPPGNMHPVAPNAAPNVAPLPKPVRTEPSQTQATPPPAVHPAEQQPQPGPAKSLVAAIHPAAPIQAVVNELETSPEVANFVKLLNQAGLIEQPDPQAIYRKALADPIAIAQVFHAAGVIAESDFENVKRCHQAVSNGELTMEEAARALKLSKAMKLPVEQVLDEENGWTLARSQAARRKGMVAGFLAGCAATFAAFCLLSLGRSRD